MNVDWGMFPNPDKKSRLMNMNINNLIRAAGDPKHPLCMHLDTEIRRETIKTLRGIAAGVSIKELADEMNMPENYVVCLLTELAEDLDLEG